MSRYIDLIHKEPESDYVASFPDFPGSVTAGPDLDEARGIAEEALAFHIERMTEDVAIIPDGFSRRRPGGPAGDRALSGSRKDLILEQLDRLAVSPDNLVDTADIPAAPVENWIRARRGYPDP
jgi:predicted RNase H-like HicB family nuclease